MTRDFDMIVLGAGAAGLTAAGMSALLGAKTALIEQDRLGGECTWVGCIPSKTLLRAASVAHEMRSAARFGLESVPPGIPFAKVMEHVRAVRRHVYEEADAPPNVEKLGVEVIKARAQFIDPWTIELTGAGEPRHITSRYFVIATGSRPRTPNVQRQCMTNESVFELTERPKRLLVIGAGPVGVEMAQAFQRLGSTVTVVAPQVLPKDDPEHAKLLQECMTREGVEFRLGKRVTGFERTTATLDDGSTLECDAALAAIGREANLDGLQLEKVGVKASPKGIDVDPRCRTSRNNIFACGDVLGRHQFTHMAEHTAKVAVTNAILHWPKSIDSKHIVWATFTHPEIAHLGQSEAELKKAVAEHKVYRFPYRKLDRAITDGDAIGEIKVMTNGSGHILGASIAGANAGEMISEYALAMRNGLKLSAISDTVHPYPTYLLGNRRAADQAEFKQLDSPLLAALGFLFRYRGVRKGSAAL